MYDKNQKRHIAFEVLAILGHLALLTFITRLWPILLLIILGIFIAALRLLFLSSRKVEPSEPMPLLPSCTKPLAEQDVQSMAYSIIQRRITQILSAKYPGARWIWENSRAKEDILIGNAVYVLLNRAGGYRRGRVILQNLAVVDIDFEKEQPNPPTVNTTPSTPGSNVSVQSEADEDDLLPENFGLIAFQWVEAHIMELNETCNEAIAEGLSEYLISAEELPVSESWEEICKELIRNGFHVAQCCDEGIIIEFEQ